MTEDLRIRAFEDGDRAACLRLFDSNVPTYFRPAERPEFEAFLDALPGPYLVLRSANDEPVACGGYALAEGARRADLCWGMVRSDLHGRGLGRRLALERLRKAVAHPGIETVALSTSQLTTGFYERMGFEIVSTERDGFGPGLDRCDMRLEIASVDLSRLGRDVSGDPGIRRADTPEDGLASGSQEGPECSTS